MAFRLGLLEMWYQVILRIHVHVHVYVYICVCQCVFITMATHILTWFMQSLKFV